MDQDKSPGRFLMPRTNLTKLAAATIGVVLLFASMTVGALAYIGDINLDDIINSSDLNIIKQTLGTDSLDTGFNPFADLNLDNKINAADLAIAGRSYGSAHALHFPRQVSNTGTAYEQAACIDGLDRINIIWSSSSKVYYSRLDRYGNTLVDDFWLDNVSSATDLAVGCDDAGNAHAIWNCSEGLCQARFDPWGYPVIGPSVAYDQDTINQLAIDLDSHGNPHIFFEKYWRNVQIYARFDTDGNFVLGSQSQLSGSSTVTPYRDIALDAEDNVHLMWYEVVGDDRIYYARYSAGDSLSIPDTVIGNTGFDGIINGSREPAMALDPDGNAFILYANATDHKLYLDKIAPDGSLLLDNYEIFPEWEIGGYTPKSEITLDNLGYLHLFSITAWGHSVYKPAYGSFTNDGAPLYPMRWIIYGNAVQEPKVMVDSQDEVHFTYRPNYPTGYPSCPDNSMCYQGTAFEPHAYDLTLSDPGIDAAHLSWEPMIARWNEPLVITATVFNAGWVASPPTSVRVDIEVTTGTVLGPPAQMDVSIPALSPRQTHTFTATLSLPFTPPAGMEELEYLRLLLDVDRDGLITETTETNNTLALPILVQKLPTKTGLFLMVRDDTDTARSGSGVGVNTGSASIEGGAYSVGAIPVTEFVTILGNEIPVTDSVITYTVGWEATGYSTPPKAEIGVKRNSSDPYIIDYNSSNTAVLVTDRWGSLSGTISKSDGGGGGLDGANVRLTGMGLSINATTDTNGQYSPSTLADLGKLIPGEYDVRISRANYARITDTLTIDALGSHSLDKTLDPTTDAYIHGNVVNDFGNPVVSANVNACGTITTTDAQGVFDLTANASCTTLQLSRTSYANLNETIALTAGLELVLSDLTMTFDPPLNVFSASDKVGSRVIDQSTGDLLPEPPDDANWLQKQLYEKFKSKFWADFKIYLVYGAYAYNAAAGYSGPSDDRHMNYIQLNFDPKTFEVHMLLASVKFSGVPIPVPIVDDSGETTAIRVIEARLVNTSNGHVIKTIYAPLEGASYETITENTTLTYDFNSEAITNWDNTEVWLYYTIGKNVGGSYTPMSGQLYQCDRQIMKFKLSSGEIWIDYGLGDFPLP
jgi:hypothetical protein